MTKGRLKPVIDSLPPLAAIKAQARGDANLELVVERMHQIEALLEAVAHLRAAGDGHRPAAEEKVARLRDGLKGAMH